MADRGAYLANAGLRQPYTPSLLFRCRRRKAGVLPDLHAIAKSNGTERSMVHLPDRKIIQTGPTLGRKHRAQRRLYLFAVRADNEAADLFTPFRDGGRENIELRALDIHMDEVDGSVTVEQGRERNASGRRGDQIAVPLFALGCEELPPSGERFPGEEHDIPILRCHGRMQNGMLGGIDAIILEMLQQHLVMGRLTFHADQPYEAISRAAECGLLNIASSTSTPAQSTSKPAGFSPENGSNVSNTG